MHADRRIGLLVLIFGTALGCHHPKITAVSLDPCHYGKECGIPFYLPKPLLIVAKNFRNIEESKVGLTGSAPIPNHYDDQSKYADLNARTNFQGLSAGDGTGAQTAPNPANTVTASGTAATAQAPTLHSNGAPLTPNTAPSDGLSPATFYTYHIVFVPDLSQKYGLKLRGGPGEIRAAMNLVNGWQFTGMGPFYMKDSSTAQNVLAGGISTRLGGQAVADVLKGVADLTKEIGGLQSAEVPATDRHVQSLAKTIETLPQTCEPMEIPNFAEIHVYEPTLQPDGRMEWTEIVNLSFNRHYLGAERTQYDFCEPATAKAPASSSGVSGLQSAEIVKSDADVAKMAVAGLFGISPESPALVAGKGLQNADVGSPTPAGNFNQVQVACGDNANRPTKEFNLLKVAGLPFHKHKESKHGRVETKVVRAGTTIVTDNSGPNPGGAPPSQAPEGAGPGLQSGESTTGPNKPTVMEKPILNQPVLNQPVMENKPASQAPPPEEVAVPPAAPELPVPANP